MIVGVPTEVKNNENRVGATPASASAYIDRGHTMLIQKGAGIGSGFTDEEYKAHGCRLTDSAEEIWAQAEMVVKVKEPIAQEYPLLRKGQILFTYLHLAADETLTNELVNRGVQAIAYETVQLENGSLPLLTPMSEVAGRMSVQIGARFLEKPEGGKGILLGGVPGVHAAEVVIIGGGVVGTNAAKMALGLGANVTIIDVNVERLRYLDDVLDGRIHTLASTSANIANSVAIADLVIGSVLVPGARAPKLVTAEMVDKMSPGTVMVDVAIDQGGCFETSKPTTHSNPVYIVNNVLHYCVTNMPGALPRTGTQGLANVTTPYGVVIATKGWEVALTEDPALGLGANVINGKIVQSSVAAAFGKQAITLTQVIGGKHSA